MKILIKTISILFITVLVIQDAYSKNSNVININIELSKSRALNKRVFGIHGELLWSPIRYGSDELVKEYKKLGFTNIRFPGGTTSNYYLWDTGNFGCNSDKEPGDRAKKRIKKFNKALNKKGRSYSIDDFLSFIKSTNTGFSLVVNVLCDSPENTRDLMKKIKLSGVNLEYVELGNELNYKEHFWKFPRPVDYVNKAKEHALAIKSVFPDAKIGVVASSSAYRSKYFPDIEKASNNKKYKRGFEFDRLAAAADFSDAIVFHAYTPLGASRYDKARRKMEYDDIYLNSLSYMDDRLLPALQYFKRLNPSKELWVTEWGLAFYGWLRPLERGYRETFYQALFSADTLLKFSASGYVDEANFHNLTGLWRKVSKKHQPNSSYKVFKFLNSSLLKYNSVSPVLIEGVSSYAGTHPNAKQGGKEIDAAFYHDANNGVLVIINKLNRVYKLASLMSDKNVSMSFTHSEQILPAKKGDPSSSEVKINTEAKLSLDEMSLPPFSITKIYINMAQKK